MTEQLIIPETERTLRVELTTLTVQGRRLARVLYNQLREEPLIGEDGALNGVPWGYVNEHVKGDECGRYRGRNADGQYNHSNLDRSHRHVVWQRDDELLRDVVLSLEAAERRFAWVGSELMREWGQVPPHTIPTRRRSHNTVAGLPQIFIGR
jgi:hypothetical protein